MTGKQCGSEDLENENTEEYEIVRIKKAKSSCSLCEDYSKRQAIKPIAILSCEGGCLRGEVSRQAANRICHHLTPETTVRVCLGGAFTKDTGQRSLVRNAKHVVAIEGCSIRCASRMMQGVIGDLQPEIIFADTLYEMDGDYFGVDELPEEQIRGYAEIVAGKVVDRLGLLAVS